MQLIPIKKRIFNVPFKIFLLINWKKSDIEIQTKIENGFLKVKIQEMEKGLKIEQKVLEKKISFNKIYNLQRIIWLLNRT